MIDPALSTQLESCWLSSLYSLLTLKRCKAKKKTKVSMSVTCCTADIVPGSAREEQKMQTIVL